LGALKEVGKIAVGAAKGLGFGKEAVKIGAKLVAK